LTKITQAENCTQERSKKGDPGETEKPHLRLTCSKGLKDDLITAAKGKGTPSEDGRDLEMRKGRVGLGNLVSYSGYSRVRKSKKSQIAEELSNEKSPRDRLGGRTQVTFVRTPRRDW